MSTLVFDGTMHTLTLYNAKNEEVQHWDANNVVDHRATLRFVPNGVYSIVDKVKPHRHKGKHGGDTVNGSYGTYGIIRLSHFVVDGKGHDGVGIHSGRKFKGGPNHATFGCIRTTDEAMKAIAEHILKDPLLSITVQHNHNQHKIHSQHQGDPHPHGEKQSDGHPHDAVLV